MALQASTLHDNAVHGTTKHDTTTHKTTAHCEEASSDASSLMVSAPTNALTRNERLVLEALMASTKALKAYDLLNQLHDHGLRAPMTIYRALDALTARGLVKKIANLNAFVALQGNEPRKACAFLICRDCQKVRQVSIAHDDVHTLLADQSITAQEVCIEAFADCKSVCGSND